jgi:Leucine-rich repeat (LRR) protein
MEEAHRRIQNAIATGATTLNLSHLRLTSLPENIFVHLTSLQELYIIGNQLTSLPEDIFAPLTNLQSLSISGNNLNSLPENIFAPLTNLQLLNISYNQLSSLPEDIFAHLINLQSLTISGNKLVSLPGKIFAPLIGLQSLYILDNKLISLPENIFTPLTKLQLLNILQNKLISLPENIFTPLTNLQLLNISYNKLTNLPENIFTPLSGLQKLYMSYNQLTNLPENIFTPLSGLQKLFINNNKLTNLPENIFTSLYGLQELCLHDNQLTSLPLSILGCRRLTYFRHFGMGMELTLDIRIQRFIDRMQNYNNHGIFKDGQNIHASSIQTSTKLSIDALFKDPFDCSKDDIVKECITWSISCLPDLLTYLDDTDVHSTLFVSFYDVFVKVFGRIMSHPNKTDIIHRLNEELQESECKCFTGRLTRLVNCLVGFYDDIAISISDSERISAIILSTLDGREMTEELKKICVDKLKAIDIADDEIEKWLS